MPDRYLDEISPRLDALARFRIPQTPSIRIHHPASVPWGDDYADPGLHGLYNRFQRATRLAIGTVDPLWTLPFDDVLTVLAWHPHKPLVAGLCVRRRRACVFIADYARQFIQVCDDVPAAVSLTPIRTRSNPLRSACDRLVILSPAAGEGADDAGYEPRILEAHGPGFVELRPTLAALNPYAAAHVTLLDPKTQAIQHLLPPLLVSCLSVSPSERYLLLEHAADSEDREGLTFLHRVIGIDDGRVVLEPPTGARWAIGGSDLLTWQTDVNTVQVWQPGHAAAGLPVSLDDGEQSQERTWWVVADGDRIHTVTYSPGRLRVDGQPPASLPPGARLTGTPVVGQGHRLLIPATGGDSNAGISVVDLRAGTAATTFTTSPAAYHQSMLTADTLLAADHRRYTITGNHLRLAAALPAPVPAVPAKPMRTMTSTGPHLWHTPGNGDAVLLRIVPFLASEPQPPPPQDAGPAPHGYTSGVLHLPIPWTDTHDPEPLTASITNTIRGALTRLGNPTTVVLGHSFGATLALLALAHIPELAGAITLSGCYNRTLTSSGFQYEKRTYWQAKHLYRAFSALEWADRIHQPVMIIHGAEDTHPATSSEQAIDFYRALIAAGGTARLVLLPAEGHNYTYIETQHTIATQTANWIRHCTGQRATPKP